MADPTFRSRLRRLRREEPGAARADGPAAGGASEDERGGERGEGEPEALEVADAAGGPAAARTTRLAHAHRHGGWRLDEVLAARRADFVLTSGDEALGALDPRRAVYLDTETTGLSGGAGTYVFLIGLGSFSDDGFEVWQGFLREPGEERALLAACCQRIAGSSGVVSFFGKSFDRHRLEDKMRVCGLRPPFDGVPHLDLYHPLRRLYGPAYADGRLRTLESELCEVSRAGDVPGSFAPEAWFDYLAGRAHRLEGVFRHNLDDVLSLVTLAAHLGCSTQERRADGSSLPGCARARARGLAGSFLAARRRAEALEWIERALEREEGGARDLAVLRADVLRLEKRAAEALEAYRAVTAGPEDAHTVPALLQVAKILEHDARDFAGALECCRAARAVLDRRHVGAERARLAADLDGRARRLAGKVESDSEG